MFVVLGIAADNVFVFTDAWKQSASMKSIKDDRVKRMSLTWRRASKASFVTTITTAIAFTSNVGSGVMPIRSFGIFASVLVPMNYLLIIAIFPAHIIIHERYFNGCLGFIWKKFKQLIKKSEADKPSEPKVGLIERFFAGPYMKFLVVGRWIILGIFIIWMAFCGWRSSLMGALSKEEQWLPCGNDL